MNDILATINTFLVGIGYLIMSLFTGGNAAIPASTTPTEPTSAAAITASTSAIQGVKVYTQADLLAMAGDDFASGSVPLGDYKYTTTGPKKGYVYLCNVRKDTPGSAVNGPWITGSTWNFKQKVTVDGSVSWKEATFSNTLSGAYRTLTGNDLPINHTTGVFPVAKTDDAAKYDPNPNTISAQTIKANLPSNPTYSATPYCMGGEVGIMLTGVALFNGFDAGLRDAPAHELQDSCDGHPQGSGEYHYHSIPSCLKDTSVSTVIGFAYDGFPITGPVVTPGKYLTTSDLDECHGLTSEVTLDGKKVTTYHYVMTYDFPYSASCFRGKAISPQEAIKSSGTSSAQPQQGGTPPQAAITACGGKSVNATCSFTGGRGEIVSGTCQTPPGASLVCVPR